MSLSGIPPAALRAALADPRNDGPAKQALERALSRSRASGPVGVRQGDGVAQKGTEALGDGLSSLTVVLPLPPKALHPNGRVHWRIKAGHVGRYRRTAWVLTVAALAAAEMAPPWWERATAQATFYYRVNRRRDEDGALSSLKAAFDGIADARIVADDSCFTHLAPRLLVDRERPRVVITLTRIDP